MPASPTGVRLRLGFYYAAYFLAAGIHLPYWPVWLASRGMDAAAIGLLAGAVSWIRILVGPGAGWLADRTGDRKRLMAACGWLTAIAFSLFYWAEGFWQLAVVCVAYGMFWSPIMGLGDSLAIAAANRAKVDFARIRIAGSISFIAASFLGGWALQGNDPMIIYWMIMVAMLLQAISNLLLPDERVPPAPRRGGAPIERLLRDRLFVTFVLVTGLAQASHAMVYAFGTLHWRALGLSESMIGLLWAEGVVAEVILFWLGSKVLRRLSPMALFSLGAAAGVVRWIGTAYAESLWSLMLLQALHGLTFGAAYLGAVFFVARVVRPEAAASAQSLYTAMSGGLALAAGFSASGPLYDWLGGEAFLIMAAMSAMGALGGLFLMRRWGDRVIG